MAYNSNNTPANFDRCVAVTPADATPLAQTADGLLVTAAGNIVFTDSAGNSNTITGALVGSIYPIKVRIVASTGTTASVSALYVV